MTIGEELGQTNTHAKNPKIQGGGRLEPPNLPLGTSLDSPSVGREYPLHSLFSLFASRYWAVPLFEMFRGTPGDLNRSPPEIETNCDHFSTFSCEKKFDLIWDRQSSGQYFQGPPGNLALATWAGWSAGQVGRHVKCWRREWNIRGGPCRALPRERGLYLGKVFTVASKFLVTQLLTGPVCLSIQGRFEEPVRSWVFLHTVIQNSIKMGAQLFSHFGRSVTITT